jgi:NAD(P)H-nitrite reductase large subunit
MIQTDIFIIGAGIAGLKAAEEILNNAPDTSICIINAEKGKPYKRTKINKTLNIKIDTSPWQLKNTDWFDKIEYIEAEKVIAIDRERKTAKTNSGTEITYKQCLLAKGSAADRISNNDIPVHLARTAEDIVSLQADLPGKESVLVLGDGVLAVELAAELVKLVPHVTLAGKNSRLVHRNFSPLLSGEIANLLAANGVQVLLGTALTNIEYSNTEDILDFNKLQARASLVIQASGVYVPDDINIFPPLEFDNGYIVDKYFRTTDPDIYAAGECARPLNAAQSALWHCSEHQGITAGKNLSGQKTAWSARPFRMKCEIFNSYFFSMNPFSGDTAINAGNSIYQEWYVDKGLVRGVNMFGDKDKNKIYEKAVLENWSLAQVNKELAV